MSIQNKLDSGAGYPLNRDMKFGTKLESVITLVNDLKSKYNALVAQFNLVLTDQLGAVFTVGGLATHGSASPLFKTANTIQYSIANKAYLKAATDSLAFTAASIQANATYCLYMVTLDVSGNFATVKGTAVATDVAVLPAVPASQVCVGYIKVNTGGASTFTAGTTNLDAAGLVVTYVDLSGPSSGASLPAAGVVTSAATVNDIETAG